MTLLASVIFVTWLLLATRSSDLVLTTSVSLLGIVVLVLAMVLKALAVGRTPDRVTSDADAGGPEPPSRQWRFHNSKKDVTCSGCSATVEGGYWVPWQYDAIIGLHHGGTEDHYCGPCAEFRQEAEKLGTNGVAEAYAAGNLSEEARDEMIDYLVEHEGTMP